MPTEIYASTNSIPRGTIKRIESNSVVIGVRFPNVLTSVLRLDPPQRVSSQTAETSPSRPRGTGQTVGSPRLSSQTAETSSSRPTGTGQTISARSQVVSDSQDSSRIAEISSDTRQLQGRTVTGLDSRQSDSVEDRTQQGQTVTGLDSRQSNSAETTTRTVSRNRNRFRFNSGDAQARSGETTFESPIELESTQGEIPLFDLQNNVFVFSPFLPDESSHKFYLAFENESYNNRVYRNYFGITEMEMFFVRGEDRTDGELNWDVYYDNKELEILKSKYSPEDVVFALEQDVNFSFERGEGDTFNLPQEIISYDSISGLGAITAESLTISVITGSLSTQIADTNTTERTSFAGGIGLGTGATRELDERTQGDTTINPRGVTSVEVVRSGY